MPSSSKHLGLQAFDPLSARETSAVLEEARTLQRAALAGLPQTPLRGKNFGLLCETDEGDAALFRRAAVELGAHVSHIRPSLSRLNAPTDVRDTARMLGRLYDAVECLGLAPELVRQVGLEAGVPVYDGIASASHPTAKLAEQLDPDMPLADNRRFVLQAVLLSTVA